jgi:purine nucleoside phosphorylase
MARIGIITGSGTYALPQLEVGGRETVPTEWGDAEVVRGTLAGAEIVHVSRHGEGHVRLSNHVTQRANVDALRQAGCDAVIAMTVCGAVDPQVELGSLIVFDDLHFLANRLADGSLCTFHDTPGDTQRGHWIFEEPYSPELRRALLAGARAAGVRAIDGGCYGHVDGPRFNTRADPETVLCGEAELPFALVGYATDHANGVMAEATPVERLLELIAASTAAFAAALSATLEQIDADALAPAGINYRFHEG